MNANEAVKTALKLRDEALEKQTSLVEQSFGWRVEGPVALSVSFKKDKIYITCEDMPQKGFLDEQHVDASPAASTINQCRRQMLDLEKQ